MEVIILTRTSHYESFTMSGTGYNANAPAEVYNMAVLPYHGLYLGFPTIFNPVGCALSLNAYQFCS